MAEYSEAVAELLAKVNEGFEQPLTIKVGDEASGILRNENADTTMDEDGNGTIDIKDATNVNYTLSHELLHILLRELNYPTTGTAVHSPDNEYDQQMRAIAGALEAGVVHTMVAGWQGESGLLTEDVLKAVRAGIEADTPDETDEEDDGEVLTRIFNLLDGLVVLGGPESDYVSAWYTKYPRALKAASHLWQTIQETDITDARGYRSGIVKMFKAFNEALIDQGINLDFAGFICVTPVFSARQLRLKLNQLYLLQDSVYISNKPDTQAYAALGVNDDQCAFVLQLTEKETQPENFQALYQKPMQEVLDEYGIGYSERK
jgi:hypothetical protein